MWGTSQSWMGRRCPPVEVICGGSPCQDLSVAGKRKGLAGERSGLFMEGTVRPAGISSFHVNQRDEVIDLGGLSGALMATRNMQMQTFVREGMRVCCQCV